MFIVEGHMERAIVKSICGGFPVVLGGCNGSCVTIATMAKAHADLIKMQSSSIQRVFIIVDREDRPESCIELETSLRLEIMRHLGKGGATIDVVFVDRMFENVLLRGAGSMGHEDLMIPEGERPISHINELCKRMDMEWSKSMKQVVGKKLFYKVDVSVFYENSASFRKIALMLREVNCYFFDPLDQLGLYV